MIFGFPGLSERKTNCIDNVHFKCISNDKLWGKKRKAMNWPKGVFSHSHFFFYLLCLKSWDVLISSCYLEWVINSPFSKSNQTFLVFK